MILRNLVPSLMFITLASTPLAASHHHSDDRHQQPAVKQAYGKLSASPTIQDLVITNPQGALPPVTGWQPFPVDIFSTSLNTTSSDPTSATIVVKNSGTYSINALLTLEYPTPGSNGPDDLTGYAIGVICNDQLQLDSIGSIHISTEGGQENPGLLFSCSLSDIVTLPANSTVQFVVAGTSGAASPAFMQVASANASIVQIGN